MIVVLGILAGVGLPFQTSVNTGLRKKVGSPYYASFISFLVAFLFLVCLLLITGQGISFSYTDMAKEPFWIWTGGLCGVIILTGNIYLLSRLGSVQTVVLPVFGQILMGFLIDGLGLFAAPRLNITFLRLLGAVLVAVGVATVSVARERKADGKKEEEGKKKTLWFWRIFGVASGMLSATQTAVNGYLGKMLQSPIKASVVSFGVGIGALAVLCLCVFCKKKKPVERKKEREFFPWWIWTGGLLGGTYILAGATLSGIVGTGMAVIALLIGSTAGGLLIDHFGLLGTERKPINGKKLLGVIVMIAGAAVIRLFPGGF